jgi:8-oxo-dGTP pyrophosphatase MutT (NUDIX family)
MLYRETPDVLIQPKFIDDERVYAEALEAFVVVCADCIFINRDKGTVFLAKRIAKPMSRRWWFVGGRVCAGEDERTAMIRCIKRETGLEVCAERLTFVSMKRYFFKDRQQVPQEKGCDSLCYVFGLEVTRAEVEQIRSNLDPKEYDVDAGLQEFNARRLKTENVFPSVVDVYETVFPKQGSDLSSEK